jgi:hypothetical protein
MRGGRDQREQEENATPLRAPHRHGSTNGPTFRAAGAGP